MDGGFWAGSVCGEEERKTSLVGNSLGNHHTTQRRRVIGQGINIETRGQMLTPTHTLRHSHTLTHTHTLSNTNTHTHTRTRTQTPL